MLWILSILRAVIAWASSGVRAYGSFKIFGTGLLMYLFPIVFSYVFSKASSYVFMAYYNRVTDTDTSKFSDMVVQFTGLGAWLIHQIGADDAAAMVLSASVSRFVISLMPTKTL